MNVTQNYSWIETNGMALNPWCLVKLQHISIPCRYSLRRMDWKRQFSPELRQLSLVRIWQDRINSNDIQSGLPKNDCAVLVRGSRLVSSLVSCCWNWKFFATRLDIVPREFRSTFFATDIVSTAFQCWKFGLRIHNLYSHIGHGRVAWMNSFRRIANSSSTWHNWSCHCLDNRSTNSILSDWVALKLEDTANLVDISSEFSNSHTSRTVGMYILLPMASGMGVKVRPWSLLRNQYISLCPSSPPTYWKRAINSCPSFGSPAMNRSRILGFVNRIGWAVMANFVSPWIPSALIGV